MIAYYIGRVLVVVQTSTRTLSVPMVFCMSVHVRVLFVRENNLLIFEWAREFLSRSPFVAAVLVSF